MERPIFDLTSAKAFARVRTIVIETVDRTIQFDVPSAGRAATSKRAIA
jgi:hypothetical protein